MKIFLNKNNQFDIECQKSDNIVKSYKISLINYLNIFKKLFDKASEKSEFDFMLTLLNIKSLKGPGWDYFESTINIVRRICDLDKKIEDFETVKNLRLWLYGHIVEATAPYEIIMILLSISMGEKYNPNVFPVKKGGKKIDTDIKIAKIKKRAEEINLTEIKVPFKEVWNRGLRNAVFHSRYSIYQGEVRFDDYKQIGEEIIQIPLSISNTDSDDLINKSIAYIDSLDFLKKIYLGSYKKPKIIKIPKYYSNDFDDKNAVVIVRKGYGAVGIKHNWSKEEIAKGKIAFRIGRFYKNEQDLLDSDPILAFLPKR